MSVAFSPTVSVVFSSFLRFFSSFDRIKVENRSFVSLSVFGARETNDDTLTRTNYNFERFSVQSNQYTIRKKHTTVIIQLNAHNYGRLKADGNFPSLPRWFDNFDLSLLSLCRSISPIWNAVKFTFWSAWILLVETDKSATVCVWQFHE